MWGQYEYTTPVRSRLPIHDDDHRLSDFLHKVANKREYLIMKNDSCGFVDGDEDENTYLFCVE